MPNPSRRKTGWLPPRGPRRADGEWRYTLRNRPLHGGSVESRAALNFRDIVSGLEDARYDGGLSLAQVARQAGLSKAAVADLESGRKWGSWSTLTRYADVVGYQLAFDEDPHVVTALMARTRRYSRERSPTTLAHWCDLQPETLLRLTETSAPHAATVLAVAAAFRTPVSATARAAAADNVEGLVETTGAGF